MHTSDAISTAAAASVPARRPVAAVFLALALGYAVVLTGTFLQGHFLVDRHGLPIANDFVEVYAAGKLALAGNAATAYDVTLKATEASAIGHDFPNYYGWPYPPTFFFVAAALAMLPYLAAAIAWLTLTLAAYAATLRAVTGDRIGVLLGLGFPAAIWNVTAGQNGFLTATLIGGTLALMPRRPALAGLFLGLLTYKPQFGLLFPIVLIADRQWRTLLVAALIAAGLAILAWFAFGSASWQAFAHWLPITSRAVLGQGVGDFYRLQSPFGLIRNLGGGEMLAWTAQISATVILAGGMVWLWRRPVAFELKAAALAAGALLATPYVYMYDLAALAVPVGFLLRVALPRGLTTSEIVGLACAGALILGFPYLKTQVGFGATLIVLALVIQRACANPAPGPRVRRTDEAIRPGPGPE